MNMPQHFYTVAWAGWFVYFGIIEYIALRDPNRGDTLSEYVWYAMFQHGTDSWRVRPAIGWMLMGLIFWLFIHFVFKGRWG